MSPDDPLFDPSRPGDALLRRVERALRPLRHRPRALDLDALPDRSASRDPDARPAPGPARLPASGPDAPPEANEPRGALTPLLVPLALAASLVLAAWAALQGGMRDPSAAPSYPVRVLAGAPRIEAAGGEPVRPDLLAPGQRLVCDEGASARLLVGEVGAVDLSAGSRVRAVAEPGDGWRLDLERGELSASIFTAPRRFRVGTPAGLAVDMGCVYTARVAGDGTTTVTVRGGLVSFEHGHVVTWVPEGAVLVVRPGAPPATPVWLAAGPAYAAALGLVDAWAAEPEPDTLDDGRRMVLKRVLDVSDPAHTLSLWHLLRHPWALVREAAYARAAQLSPPPAGSTRDQLLAPDGRAREQWRRFLAYHWARGPAGD